VIHDAFGKGKVYETLFHAERFASTLDAPCAAMRVGETYLLPE
jgi:hypothetical protein